MPKLRRELHLMLVMTLTKFYGVLLQRRKSLAIACLPTVHPLGGESDR